MAGFGKHKVELPQQHDGIVYPANVYPECSSAVDLAVRRPSNRIHAGRGVA